MPNTQSRATRGRPSRSNRGPRAGKSSKHPEGRRTPGSNSSRRHLRKRRGNAASQVRGGRKLAATAGPTGTTGGGKHGRGRGGGSRRSVGHGGYAEPDLARSENEVAREGDEIRGDHANPIRDRRSNERRLRKDDPLVVGRDE